jgi:hypothetical protein
MSGHSKPLGTPGSICGDFSMDPAMRAVFASGIIGAQAASGRPTLVMAATIIAGVRIAGLPYSLMPL